MAGVLSSLYFRTKRVLSSLFWHRETSWPKVVGERVIPAGLAILRDRRPDVGICFCYYPGPTELPPFDLKRVILYHNDHDVAVATPTIG